MKNILYLNAIDALNLRSDPVYQAIFDLE